MRDVFACGTSISAAPTSRFLLIAYDVLGRSAISYNTHIPRAKHLKTTHICDVVRDSVRNQFGHVYDVASGFGGDYRLQL